MTRKLKVAIIGTAGLPPNYGGFETLSDYLTKHLGSEIDFVVYCPKSKGVKGPKIYNRARLIYLPLKANGVQSLIYDVISILHAIFYCDRLLILGSGGCVILPFLFPLRRKFILNFGGLEWKRGKWGRLTRAYLKFSERLGVKCSHVVIADNQYFVDYVKAEYNISSTLIEYGGDHCVSLEESSKDFKKQYPFLHQRYFLSISRAQEDNNIHLLLQAFRAFKDQCLVVISNWSTSEYGRNLKREYSDVKNIVLVDAIYDLEALNYIRAHCHVYIHSHSFCGTAPSLVEIMNLGKPVIAFATPTNFETTENKAEYFKSANDILTLIGRLSNPELAEIGARMKEIANRRYTWEIITDKYLKAMV